MCGTPAGICSRANRVRSSLYNYVIAIIVIGIEFVNEDRSEKSIKDTTPPELQTVTIEVGVCPTCEYALKGQPVPGTCPECGKKYTNQAELPMRAKPSAFKICLLYGWPLVFFVLSFGIFIDTSNDPYAFAGWMFICLIIFAVSVVNGGIMTAWLLKRHQPQDRSHLDNLNKRMGSVGSIVVFMFYLMVVLLLIIGGGCTLLMFGFAQ